MTNAETTYLPSTQNGLMNYAIVDDGVVLIHNDGLFQECVKESIDARWNTNGFIERIAYYYLSVRLDVYNSYAPEALKKEFVSFISYLDFNDRLKLWVMACQVQGVEPPLLTEFIQAVADIAQECKNDNRAIRRSIPDAVYSLDLPEDATYMLEKALNNGVSDSVSLFNTFAGYVSPTFPLSTSKLNFKQKKKENYMPLSIDEQRRIREEVLINIAERKARRERESNTDYNYRTSKMANTYSKNLNTDFYWVDDPSTDYYDPAPKPPAVDLQKDVNRLTVELQVAKDSAENVKKALREKIEEIRTKAETAVAEANDAVHQLEQSPAAVGIVVDVAYPSYEREDLEEGKFVRLHKGIASGAVGKIVQIVDNYQIMVEVQDRYTNSKQRLLYFYKPLTKVLLVKDEDSVTPAYNHEYKVGDLVVAEVTKPKLAYPTEVKGKVIESPSPAGDMVIEVQPGEEYTVNVGYSGYVTLAEDNGGWAYVMVRGELRPVALPKRSDIEVGGTVIMNDSGQIIEQTDVLPQFGGVFTFNKVVAGNVVELTNKDGAICMGYNVYAGTLEKGDQVLMDASNTVLFTKYAVEEESNTFTGDTGVSWDDIGGCEDAKLAFMEAIEYPITHADMYTAYGIKPPKGIMLYGSPGTGKTMIAKAAVTSLKKYYGSTAESAFIYLKGPEVLSQWVGVAEEKIRNIFKQARAHKAKHGYPAIVFIDEADAILRQRGSSKSSDVDKTIVPQFLAEMDGLDDHACILVLATNRPDSLDSAVTRNGRVDRKVKVHRPDAETSAKILDIYLKGVPLVKGLTNQQVISYTIEKLFDPTLAIKAIKMTSGIELLTLGKVVNGAMLKSIVDLAKSRALCRDLSAKKATGTTLDDFKHAVKTMWEENLNVNYDEDISDMVGSRYKEVVGIEKIEGIPNAIA